MNVLAVGAHPDDIELGCGGVLLRHAARGDEVGLLVMTRGQLGRLHRMSRTREQEAAARALSAQLKWGGFDDGAVPSGTTAIAVVDEAVAAIRADVMYTHAPRDTHQDHRATSEASLAAARRVASVLYYETPSTQAFDPTVFVDINSVLNGKLAAIRLHLSQIVRDGPVDPEAIEAQAKFRGFQGRGACAEAFETARFTWDLADAAAEVPAVGSSVLGVAR